MAGILKVNTIQNANASNIVTQTNSTTITIGTTGQTVALASGASQSGFGPTGAVSWNTTKITADPNPAVTGVGYFCDTTAGSFTVTLPLTPSAGAVVGISDYANTFATNNLTVGRNSSNIGGVANNAVLSTNGLSVTFVYVDATQGWIVTDSGNRSDLPVPQFVAATGGCIVTSGNYKIHSFTGPGTFTVTSAGNPLGSTVVDYMVVAGGGGSGLGGGGGGGAGGFRESVPSPAAWTASPLASPGGALPVTVQGYPITVGSGGAGLIVPSPSPNVASSGNPSIFSTITSAGGGGSRSQSGTPTPSGGSGAGGAAGNTPGGTGNTPPVSPSQGNNGGSGIFNPAVGQTAGGGGGATSVGGNGTVPGTGGAGGNGATTSISGSPTIYAGGGGGGSDTVPVPGGAAGPGGGGIGGNRPDGGTSTNGTANTGGGAGGTGESAGCGTQRNGGSGIVVIRYKFQ